MGCDRSKGWDGEPLLACPATKPVTAECSPRTKRDASHFPTSGQALLLAPFYRW